MDMESKRYTLIIVTVYVKWNFGYIILIFYIYHIVSSIMGCCKQTIT